MNIKEIIQKLHITMIDAGGQESHFESWLTLSEGIIDVIDALKALDNQEPVAWMVWGEDNVPSLTFKKPSDKYVFDSLYTTPPQIKIGCAECGVNGNYALYCVKCAEKYLKEKST